MVEVPCKDCKRPKQKTTMRIPVILPHELLHWLGQNNRFHINQTAIANFWQRWQQFKPHHPAASNGVHNPLGVTGDDAKYTLGGAKVIVIAMSLTLLDRMKMKPNDLAWSPFEQSYVMFFPSGAVLFKLKGDH